MKKLSNFDLLDLWERGSVLHPIDRALAALAVALPGESYSALAAWPLGRRNAALAQLRRICFGPVLEGWTTCPHCGQRLEFTMGIEALEQEAPTADLRIEVDGYTYRLPASRDLAAIAAEQNPQTAALALLQQCCLDQQKPSHDKLDRAGDLLSAADPLAESLIALTCAECGHPWEESLDIAAWLWTEMEAHARRLLAEVHTLAAAYGWSEQQVLSLSAPRRAHYLEMVTA